MMNIDEFVDYEKEYKQYIKKAVISNNQLTGLCPFHNDNKNSFSADLKSGKWSCFTEDIHGNFIDFYARIHNLDTEDAYKEILEKYGKLEAPKNKAYTLEQYAIEKCMPADWLVQMFGLKTSEEFKTKTTFVKIPYFDENKNPIEQGTKPSYRKRFAGKDLRWSFGSKAKGLLYGLWNISHIRQTGYVILVEGESDTQSLVYMGFPVLGIPGASMFSDENTKWLDGLKVFIHREPDAGGEVFIKNITQILKGISFKNEVYAFSCGEFNGCKDPSDMLIKYGKEEGKKHIANLIHNATKLDLSQVAGNEAMLTKFHKINNKGIAHDTYDGLICEDIKTKFNIFVLEGKIWIYESGVYEQDKNGSRLKTIIRGYLMNEVIKSTLINRIFNLFLLDSEIEIQMQDINQYPDTWIPFENGLLDVKTLKMHSYKPEYRCINQIPHRWETLETGDDIDQSLMYQYLRSWIEDEEDREMVLTYCGYALSRATFFQVFLILLGVGETGKSLFLKLVNTMVGKQNYSALSLQTLTKSDQRFATAVLFGKMCNICADNSSKEIEDEGVIKKIIGEDEVEAEIKGGAFFSFKNYAKFFFSFNRLPAIYNDKTSGFYRRLLIVKLNRKGMYIPDIEHKLMAEIDNLIYLSVMAYHRCFYKNGKLIDGNPIIKKSKNCFDNVQEYWANSDSVKAFLNAMTVDDSNGQIERKELFEAYKQYCSDEEVDVRTIMSKKNFFRNIREKGYTEKRSCGIDYFIKLSFKDNDFISLPTDIELPFK